MTDEVKTNESAIVVKQSRPLAGVWGCLIALGVFLLAVFVIITFCILLLCASCQAGFSGLEKAPENQTEFLQGNEFADDIIAVIDISGVILPGAAASGFSGICNADKVCALIRKLKEDPNVQAVIVRLDTPGGEVTASDRIYHELKNCGKPVVAQMNSLAASGGYYVASAASKIVAHRSTMTGSIGVIISTFNYHSLMNFIGIENEVYASGKMKDMLSGTRERTREEKKIVEALVENAYRQFAGIVAEARNMTVEQLKESPAGDGRILDGEQALEAGLVDQLGYFSDAVLLAEQLAELSPGSACVMHYSANGSFMEALLSFAGSKTLPLSLSLPGKAGNAFQPEQGKAYYLPAGY